MSERSTFALFFGNRGFFPVSLQKAARREMHDILTALGHDVLMLDEDATQHGAVETVEEGRRFADFLSDNRGTYHGVILCLPNFGDETGAVTALKDAGVPILVQAYPDELDKMGPELRRDAFCGKMSVMDVFCQYGVTFTALPPHTVHPASPVFARHVDYFDRLCRVVGALDGMTVGGADCGLAVKRLRMTGRKGAWRFHSASDGKTVARFEMPEKRRQARESRVTSIPAICGATASSSSTRTC